MIELCRTIFGTAEQIISQFDFSITKFAYYKAKTEDELTEYRVVYHDQFFEHLHLQRLVVDDTIPYPMSTFERMIRYAKYGYFPCKETKLKIVKALRELSDEQVEVSESLYKGLD